MSQTVLGSVVKTLSKLLQMTKHAVGSNCDIKKTCRQCCKEIATGRRKTYCSQECYVVGNMERYRKWRADNLEKAREIGRQRYWDNVEKERENYRMRKKNNPERIREISRRWYRNNKEKASETQRRWYQNNSDKAKKDAIRWQKDNPEKVREIDRRKREKHRRKAMEAASK